MIRRKKNLIRYSVYSFLALLCLGLWAGLVRSCSASHPGGRYLDLSAKDSAGLTRHLGEFLGKGDYVLLDFWASWCGPCRKAMPQMLDLYRRTRGQGLEIVGLSLDADLQAWQKAVRTLEMPWTQLHDGNFAYSSTAIRYGVRYIPFTILFDPDGVVVASGHFDAAFREKVMEVLRERNGVDGGTASGPNGPLPGGLEGR